MKNGCVKTGDTDMYFASFGRGSRNLVVLPGLSKISCPTLILAGDDDHMVGNEASHELNAAIRGSRLYLYEGLGHGAYEEGRDFYDRVYEFCEAR